MKSVVLLMILIISTPLMLFAGSSQPSGFTVINHILARGGSPSDLDKMLYLQQKGVRTVVNLQGGDLELKPLFRSERSSGIKDAKIMANSLGMNFYHLPMPATGFIGSKMNRKIRNLIAELRRPENQPVYIHCLIGKDRTSLITALFRHCTEGYRGSMRADNLGLTTVFTLGLDKFYREVLNTPGWCIDPN